jgi:hypothetical protein
MKIDINKIFFFLKGFQLLVVMENNKKIGPFPLQVAQMLQRLTYQICE